MNSINSLTIGKSDLWNPLPKEIKNKIVVNIPKHIFQQLALTNKIAQWEHSDFWKQKTINDFKTNKLPEEKNITWQKFYDQSDDPATVSPVNQVSSTKHELIRDLLSKLNLHSNKTCEIVYELSSKIPEIFLEIAYNYIPNKTKEFTNSQITSCIRSVEALSVIFSGVSKCRGIMLALRGSLNSSFTCNKAEKKIEFSVRNLFYGEVLKKIDKVVLEKITTPKDAADTVAKVARTAYDVYKPFNDAVNRSLKITKPDDNETTKAQLSVDYNFNRKIFNDFLDDIKNGFILTNENTSHIFYLSLAAFTKDTHHIYHTLILEQLWDKNLKKSVLCLYQSWFDKKTLALDMEARGYQSSKNDKLLWSQEETDTFLTNLKEFVVCGDLIAPEEIKYAVEKAFGYAVEDKFPLYWFDIEKQEFGGISFRYIMDTINPADIPRNFAEIADNLEFSSVSSI